MAMNRKDSVKVHVAAFGKHPGWDDHIEEIGLDSALLVNAKRVLYTECIGGNIDSGVWEKLDPEKQIPFKHTFYWRTGDEGVLVGRMWASRDGKGRTKYPMIVCAHIEGVPSGWAISQILPRLASIEDKCAQTNSAELVRLAIGEARRALEDAAATLVGGAPPEETPEALVSRIVNHPSNAGDARLGLVRVLYEMQRELAEFRPGTPATRSRTRMADMGAPAAQHLRVPRTLDGPGEAARAWLALLDQEIAPGTPVLIIEPQGQRFVDIIVGDPKAGQFRCVRSGEQALGLTSDVPYTLDEATQAQAAETLDRWSKGGATRGAVPSGAAEGQGAASGSRLKIALLAAGLLIVVVIVALAMRGGGKDKATPESAAPKPSQPDRTVSKPEIPEAPKPATEAASGSKGVDIPDPRTGWQYEKNLQMARAGLDRLNEELKAEGAAAVTTPGQQLDEAEKRAKILTATPWRTSSADSIARDMSSIDAQIADAAKAVDAGMEGVASRIAASLRVRGAAAPFKTDAMNRAWSSALASIDPKAGWAATKAKADTLEADLKSAETEITGVPGVEAPAKSLIDAGTLRAAVSSRQDQALQDAANGAASGDSSRVRQAADQYRQWSAQAKQVIDSASQIESRLAGAAAGDGPAIADLAANIKASPAYREVGPAVLPVLRQADAMRSVAGQNSPEALIALIKGAALDSGGRRVGEALAAWTQLPKVGWPAQADDLDKAMDLRKGALENAVGQVTDASDKARLESQCAQAAKQMWLGFVERNAATDEGLSKAESTMADFGIGADDLKSLPPWARYNLLRHDLGRDAHQVQTNEARRAAIQKFLDGVAEIGDQVARSPQASALTKQLRPLLDKSADLDLTKLGPGAAGWKAGAVSPDGASIAYSWSMNGKTHTVQFHRVSSGDNAVSFLATSEVSAGLFIDVVNAAQKWDEFKPLFTSYPAGGADPRRGPRIWEWSTNPDEVMSIAAPGRGDTSGGWLRAKTTTAGKQYYPEDLKVAPPSASDPMQYISPTAAVFAARLMGCRIPTSAEWKSALAANAPSHPNLRDQTWHREYEHVKQFVGEGPEYPSGGIFWPAEAQKVQPLQDGAAAVENDDGVLWFTPTEEAASGFENLVGNVAEYVWEDPASLDGANSTAAAAAAALGRGEKLRVVGGSALSPKEVSTTEPQPVNFPQAREGYSDVGFRLAFSAPKGASGEGAGERLDQALAASGYIAPPK